jgi:hypothetical protein
MMLDARTPIAITLTAERWNQVLGILGEAAIPHRVSDPLIREIHAQCLAADRPNVAQLREVDDAS